MELCLCIRELGVERDIKSIAHLLETFKPVYKDLLIAGAEIAIVCFWHRVASNGNNLRLDMVYYYERDQDVWIQQFSRDLEVWDLRAAEQWGRDREAEGEAEARQRQRNMKDVQRKIVVSDTLSGVGLTLTPRCFDTD